MSFSEIDAAYAAFAQEQQIPGIAAGIVQDGRLVHVTTVGLADVEASRPVAPATAFRIASMTKNMTALAILSLRDKGRLALDAPVSEYVPQFASVRPATRDSPPVTVRHLLTHTAGFVTDDPWGDRVLGMTPAELDALIATGTLFARPPGVAFEYSNLGYGLAGRVLTNVSGEPYQSYIRRTILEPLGMDCTTFDAVAAMKGDFAHPYRVDDGKWSRERVEPDGEVGAMGGLVTTVPDYARYVAFILAAWPARDDPEAGPVRRASVRELALWNARRPLRSRAGRRRRPPMASQRLAVAFAGVDPMTAYLATSPGGADSIAIIAASSNVDISFVLGNADRAHAGRHDDRARAHPLHRPARQPAAKMTPELIALCGMAFSGKSTIARRVAGDLEAELISCDAINAARGFDGGKVVADSEWEKTSLMAAARAGAVLASGRRGRGRRHLLAPVPA